MYFEINTHTGLKLDGQIPTGDKFKEYTKLPI